MHAPSPFLHFRACSFTVVIVNPSHTVYVLLSFCACGLPDLNMFSLVTNTEITLADTIHMLLLTPDTFIYIN